MKKNKYDIIINISAKLGDNIINMKYIYNYELKNNSIVINNNHQTNLYLKNISKIKNIINLPKLFNKFFFLSLIKFSFRIFLLNFKSNNIIYLGEKNLFYYYFKILFLFKKINYYNFKLINTYEKSLTLLKKFIFYKSNSLNYNYQYFFDKNDNYIVIGLGSETWIYRSFSIDKWVSILKLILVNFPNLKIVLVGRGKNDLNLAAGIVKNLSDENIINLVDKTNINKLTSIISFSKLNLLIDSGLYHLSNLVGSKQIVFFGPDSPKKWFDYNRNDSFLFYSNLSCSPCQQNWTDINWKCPFNSKCLNENISNQKIINIMKKLF